MDINEGCNFVMFSGEIRNLEAMKLKSGANLMKARMMVPRPADRRHNMTRYDFAYLNFFDDLAGAAKKHLREMQRIRMIGYYNSYITRRIFISIFVMGFETIDLKTGEHLSFGEPIPDLALPSFAVWDAEEENDKIAQIIAEEKKAKDKEAAAKRRDKRTRAQKLARPGELEKIIAQEEAE